MAASGAVQSKGQQKSKCHHSYMESCDIAQNQEESIQQFTGMAWVGFKRLITQRTTLTSPASIRPVPVQSEEPANHPLQCDLHMTILSCNVNDITHFNCSTRDSVSVFTLYVAMDKCFNMESSVMVMESI